MSCDVESIVAALAGAPKYRPLCGATLRRVAGWAAARSDTNREAIKRAKRKLHQVYAAYLGGWDPRRAERLLAELPSAASPERARPVCRRILGLHASTRERLGELDGFYDALWAITGRPASVLDVGAGLSPLALPWMDLAPEARYCAWDIDRRMIALARGFFGKLGVGHTAACRDVLCESPGGTWDVVLLLKLLPCLERQERGAGARLIGALRAAHVVVSYPAASLGGRSKGMPSTYAAQARELADATGRTLREVPCGAERVFVLGQAGSGPSG